MEFGTGMLEAADRLGVDDSFCPVRAMLGAFVSQAHFPIPDLLICSVGATCDDFSAIAQRLEGLGFPIFWWEIPHRRPPHPGHKAVRLPGGQLAAREQVQFVRGEMERIRDALQAESTYRLDTPRLREGIRRANRIRRCLRELRRLVFTADRCPLPALEMLIAEMLIIHFCSDIRETARVLRGLLAEVRRRIRLGQGLFAADAVRVFWVNPVADLRAMNWLEASGGRICGTDYLFTHALDDIPDTPDPLESLARSALADPMVGSATERAQRIVRDARRFRAEAVVISRIPGASHCAYEGAIIADRLAAQLDIPVVEMEISPVSDALQASLNTRLSALIETARARRTPNRRRRGNRQPKGEE
jgi:benzoyl-CoA reductase/2-hydroxyglutaryl-CoA dehydratase subunit BcrC/BadD/HgdB